jgi:hypothetical protein
MPRNLLLYGAAVIVGLLVFGVLRSLLDPGIMGIITVIGLVVCGVVVYRNLQTNRKVADAAPEQRTQALSFTPEPGKAALYVFRNQFVGRAVGVNVMIDGREAAQLKSPRFTRILLSPGPHRIAGYVGTNRAPAPTDGIELVANAGDIYVAKCEVEPQMVGTSIKFTPIPLDAARADLQKITKMVVADLAEI